MRKILNRARFNISEAVEKEIVHMEAHKENKKDRTVRYRTVRYMRYIRHFHTSFFSVDPASAAFFVVVAAALAPAAATATIVGIAFVVVAADVCMCVCVCR